jgi:hypothetical protein
MGNKLIKLELSFLKSIFGLFCVQILLWGLLIEKALPCQSLCTGNKLIKLELSFLESIFGSILGANFWLGGLLLEKALPCQTLSAREIN